MISQRGGNAGHRFAGHLALALLGSAGLAGLASLASLASVAGAQAQEEAVQAGPVLYVEGAQDLNGVWWTQSYFDRILPIDASQLPLTQAARETYERNRAGIADRSVDDWARRTCVPDGVPRIWQSPYPFQIFQTPGQTTIVYELNHVIRVIHMDTPVPPAEELEAYLYYSGNSYGHWEDDTLVVETVGFNGKSFLDDTGVPQSAQLHVVERIRKIGDDELEVIATITDPEIFTEPWDARFVFAKRPRIYLEDYVCGEQHRDVSEVEGAP